LCVDPSFEIIRKSPSNDYESAYEYFGASIEVPKPQNLEQDRSGGSKTFVFAPVDTQIQITNDNGEVWTTSTAPLPSTSTASSPTTQSFIESNLFDLKTKLDKIDSMLENDTVENQTMGNNVTSPQFEMANSTEKVGTVPKVSTDCNGNPKIEKSQYNAYCNLVHNYYIVQHYEQKTIFWTVFFSLKNAESSKIEYSQVAVRFWRYTDYGKATRIQETHFLLASTGIYGEIAVENLRAGEYGFQLCAVTPNFRPGLLYTEQFSWEKEAPIHRLRLISAGQKEKEKATW